MKGLILNIIIIELFYLICGLVCLSRKPNAGVQDPLAACLITKKTKDMKLTGLRTAAVDHQKYVNGATMYPLEHNMGNGILCMIP